MDCTAHPEHGQQQTTFSNQTNGPTNNQKNLKRKRTTEGDEPSTSQPKRSRCCFLDQPGPLSAKRKRLIKRLNQLQDLEQQQDVDRRVDDTENDAVQDQLQTYSQNIMLLKHQVSLLEGRHRHRGDQVTEINDFLQTIQTTMAQMERLQNSFNESKKQLGVRLHSRRTRRNVKEEQKRRQQEEIPKYQLQDALREQKKVMDKVIHFDQRLYDILLAENQELEKQRDEAIAQKDHTVARVTDVMENELQCIFCTEYLIFTHILNCGHTFCGHCINRWRRIRNECPVCRGVILSQSRCIAIDNSIKGLLENLGPGAKARRRNAIMERYANSIRPPRH